MFYYYSKALFKNKHLALFYQLSLICFSSFSPVKGRCSAQKSCISAHSLGRIFKAPNGWVKGCMQFWSLMFLFIELVYVYNFQSQIYKAIIRISVSFVALSQPCLFLTYCLHLRNLLALWLFFSTCVFVVLQTTCATLLFLTLRFRQSLLVFRAGACMLSSGNSVPHHIRALHPTLFSQPWSVFSQERYHWASV